MALFAVVAIILTYPAITVLSDRVMGLGGDAWQTMWRFEEKQGLLNQGYEGYKQFFYQDLLGGGEARLINLSVWPWMWLQVLIGQPTTYNTVWLLSYVLGGYFMYLLVKSRLPITSKSRLPAAFLAGFVYMLLPYHVAHSYGHFGAMQIQWLPLLFLLLFQWFKTFSPYIAVALGLVFTLQAWTEHHYALWFAIATFIAIAFQWQEIKTRFNKQALLSLLLTFVIVTFGVILPYMPTVRLATGEQNPLALGTEQTSRFSADLFSYVTPPSFHMFWGNISNRLFAHRFTGNIAEATQYLGLVSLLFIIFFHQHIPRKERLLWSTVGIVFFVISLGPTLHILGWTPGLPLPYQLIEWLPVFSSIRTVARAGVIVGIAVAVLVGWVIATQVSRKRMIAALAGLLVLDYLFWPIPSQSTQLSGVYNLLKESPGSRIVELPAATNYTIASRALYASHIHGKEVVGNIALERNEGKAFLAEEKSLPVLRQLLFMRTGHILKQREDFFGQSIQETLPDVFKYLDVGAVLVHTDSISSQQDESVRKYLEQELELKPRIFDDVTLYTPPISSDIPTDGIFISRDGKWQRVGYNPEQDSVFAEVIEEAGITVYNITDNTKDIRLMFTIAPSSHGNITVATAKGEQEFSAKSGETVLVNLSVPPGSLPVTFKNRLQEKVIIQNPTIDASL